MAYDDALTRNENGELALRTVNATEQSTVVNPDDVFTRDTEGNLCVRVTGNGGSGGDSHNLGYYETPEALNEAHPTAEAGDFAIVNSTDTIWVWDTDTDTWKDSDTKGQVTPDMVIIKTTTMPSASSVPAGSEYQYMGATNATYTHGYIYECVGTSTYTSTETFEPATVSGTVVTCTSDAFTSLASTYIHTDITQIVSGTMTFDSLSDLWVFVGKDAEDNTVGTYQVYQTDYEDAGFTFTGTPEEGDVVAFTCTITETTNYSWNRIDVQPHQSIKTINGNTITGSGNVELSTYLTYPAGWPTTGTTKALCDAVAADTSATKGKAYLGEVTLSDLPASMANGEIVVEIMAGTTAANKVIVLTLTSGNVAPYRWQYTYWDGGTNVSGWIGQATAPIVPTTAPVLAAADWVNSAQTITVTGVTANNIVLVGPAPASAADYAVGGVLCTAQGANSLTFTCTDTPTNDITLSVVILG